MLETPHPSPWVRAPAFPLYAIIVLLVAASSLFKIVDYDFWWHLKSGQIILDERSVPRHDDYSFTARGSEYIDHEWLFEVLQYVVHDLAGAAGVILLKCAVLAATYLLIAGHLLRAGAPPLRLLAIVLLSIAGGRTRFLERPEVYAVLFLVVFYLAADLYRRCGSWKPLMVIPPLTIVWANFHASVILGLLLLGAFAGGLLLERVLARLRASDPEIPLRRILVISLLALVCLLATGLNPYGYRVLSVPFELTALIDTRLIDNLEWRQPSVLDYPAFYVCFLVTFSLLVSSFRRLCVPDLLFAAFLGYISLKYLRNVGLFCLMMPLLIAEPLARLRLRPALEKGLAAAAFALYFFSSFIRTPYPFGAGVAPSAPEGIARFTKAAGLRGNMMNSVRFGGYLVWSLYPERRVFQDGRNEVFLPVMKKTMEASAESGAWERLLREYEIEYALLEYTAELAEVVVVGESGGAVRREYHPASFVRFPLSEWALVYWDDNGMVFVRRHGPNGRLAAGEYTSVVPEGWIGRTSFHETLIADGRLDRERAIAELNRKLQEDPDSRLARELLDATLRRPKP